MFRISFRVALFYLTVEKIVSYVKFALQVERNDNLSKISKNFLHKKILADYHNVRQTTIIKLVLTFVLPVLYEYSGENI